MAKGDKLKGALSKSPRPKEKMVRVSPGVYRSESGRIEKPRGGQMDPRRVQQRPQPVQDLGQVLGAVAGQPVNPTLGFTPNPNATWSGDAGFAAYQVGQQLGMQMPQPSANQGGRYRLSPGVYGTKEQAMRQMENAYASAVMPEQRPNQGAGNYFGQQAEGDIALAKANLDPRQAYNPKNRVEALGKRIRKMF